jgi:hypothetical protein
MPMLSYDLHVHPGPSTAPRWGDGLRVREAAAAAGVRGFVWKAHECHTATLCRQLPSGPVRAIASASLNPWAATDDVIEAVQAGARWIWGPTLGAEGEIGWELELPSWWDILADWLPTAETSLVLATGHLGAAGRATLAELAASHEHLVCSITHSPYVPLPELSRLAELGCLFEIDAYTFTHELEGRRGEPLPAVLDAVASARALLYFTSDGGQASTGNPFVFGARALERVAELVGEDAACALGVEGPATVIRWLDQAAAA